MAPADHGILPAGYRRVAHDSLPSTNAEALALARAGDAGGLWVTAVEQTAGRGRRGRAWSTARGNLAASLLLVEPGPSGIAATISFVAGVALHQAIVALAGPAIAGRLALKWPNDVLLDGRKVAGILVEGERLADGRLAVVIGFGVNCVSHPDIDGPIAADDLRSRGVPADAEALFHSLVGSIAAELTRWDAGNGFRAVRSAWLARAAGVGEAIRVNLPDRAVEGVFEDLDADGRLVLVRAGGRRERFSTGDVFFTATAG
jgi:BirA family biotin operon repressor/biotin-[acetyl-CoA-carboxylase] ligase